MLFSYEFLRESGQMSQVFTRKSVVMQGVGAFPIP